MRKDYFLDHIGIGWVLKDGYPHEMRAVDYDDWVTPTKSADGKPMAAFLAGVLLFLAALLTAGCGGTGGGGYRITVAQVESLNDLEALLPLAPDSIVTRYRNYDSLAFREIYREKLRFVTTLIDSLNGSFPDSLRIDTLAIDHSFSAFGEAARSGGSIVLSASYFIVFDDWNVLRSVLFHEFGHIAHERLGTQAKTELATIWKELEAGALLYLFHDGEYSGNARFGGHPGESPSELYASAFNLMHNRIPEIRARLTYVEARHLPLIRRLSALVGTEEEQFPDTVEEDGGEGS